MLRRKPATVLLPLLLLVALVGSGCADERSAAGPETREEELPMKLSVIMRGDREITIEDRTVPTKLIVIGEGINSVSPLLGLQSMSPIIEGDVGVIPSVSVKPFKGDGRYTIVPGSPHDILKADPETAKKLKGSAMRIEWWPSSKETEEFLRRGKSCTITVEKDGMKGRMWCPEIVGEGTGVKFSVDFRWEEP